MNLCYRCKQTIREDDMTLGLHPNCFCAWFNTSEQADFYDVVARSYFAPTNYNNNIVINYNKMLKLNQRLWVSQNIGID